MGKNKEAIFIKKSTLFTSSKGVEFERTDYKKRRRVRVMNEHMTFRTYRFDYVEDTGFNSPYISWENLNCCGGWHYDERYLYTAVQEGKKICAGLKFNSEKELMDYVDILDKSKYYYIDTSWDTETWNNKTHRWHLLDVARKGKLSDYYDLDDVIGYYRILGLNWNYIDFERFFELFNSDTLELLNGRMKYDYANPNSPEELIFTGLFLGYPIESTISILMGY